MQTIRHPRRAANRALFLSRFAAVATPPYNHSINYTSTAGFGEISVGYPSGNWLIP